MVRFLAVFTAVACLSLTGGIFSQDLEDTEFIRGDMNGDGLIRITDPVLIIKYLFQDGDSPPCLSACDADGDDDFDGLAEIVYMLNMIFLADDVPPDPYPDCGTNEDTVLNLGCNTPSCP